jgi:uncharacterized MAPEG superfamily protein
MARDMTQRVTMARVDDGSRQGKVYAARRLIYQKQYLINRAAIESLLKDQSLVPTAVYLSSHHARILLN